MTTKLCPEDSRALVTVRALQQRKTPSVPVKKNENIELVAEAYLQTFCHRKRLQPKEPIALEPSVKQQLYKFYVAGVLPIRLGGVNLNS